MAINSAKKITTLGWDDPKLDAPRFSQALNGVSGLIWRPDLDEHGGLRVDCPLGGFPEIGDEIQIEYSPVGVAVWTPLEPMILETDPTQPLVRLTIDYNILGHGEFEVRFKVKPASDTDYKDFSVAERVRIDLYGPYKSSGRTEAPARIVFPTALPLGVDITQATLDLNPGGFDFEISSYAGFEDGDGVAQVWFTSLQPPDDAPSLGSVPMESGGVEFNLPISAFEDFEDGNYFGYYRLIDAAGNLSEISRITTGRRLKRSANLVLEPIDLVVPPENELVDIEVWKAGVRLAIPSYAWESGDQYRLIWGAQSSGLLPLNGVFPFEFTASSQLILDEYATQTGAVSTPITYEIVRTGTVNKPDTEVSVDVDLSVEGPGAPTPGDPSPDLDAVTILGPASTPTPNYLNSADIDHASPIEAHFDLWTANPQPADGMVITLYWGSKLNPAGSRTVAAGEGAGDPFMIEVDKDAIAAAGNGDDIPVFYGVSRPGAANSNFSPSTSVEVDDAIIHSLDPAVFRNTLAWAVDPRGRITCSSLRPQGTGTPEGEKHIEVWIPPSTEFFANGVEVTFEFVASTGLNGDAPIESTRDTRSLTLDKNMAENGFIFELEPFDPHLKVPGVAPSYNSIWFQYSLDVAGTPAKSVPAVIPVRMLTSNNFCDGDPYTP